MSTRKLAQLSMLSAACVAGRVAFQFIPNFQPMTAILLFVVFYLGMIEGLIVMSLSLVISSFYFGMGPWVIGQWLSYGGIFLLFTLCRQSSYFRTSYWLKGIFFFLAGFIYGGLMAIYDTVLYQLPQPLVYYIQGISFDLSHAIGNLLFYLIFFPIIQRLVKQFGGKNEKDYL
ncbi:MULTISPECIES: hypothetical protein [Enterococcus]|uniref:hypothetical protein n=1 Tax=Enterococcus TaxID=1350 RepID=UPI00094DD6B0|nr:MULTISPECIES: hypothetical protein [Enterococcus]MDA3965527.1 hypothetical protein [Enterococcus thailandicus]OTP24168.1 hypothetical protein A5800_002028 [Enterococcus sp. 5B7_DIV0075]